MGITLDQALDIMRTTEKDAPDEVRALLNQWRDEYDESEQVEDRSARLDLINVHVTMSKLFDRVQQLEKECAELRIGQSQHELATEGEQHHTSPLQDRVVAIGRNRRSQSRNRSDIPGSKEVGVSSPIDKYFGDILERYVKYLRQLDRSSGPCLRSSLRGSYDDEGKEVKCKLSSGNPED